MSHFMPSSPGSAPLPPNAASSAPSADNAQDAQALIAQVREATTALSEQVGKIVVGQHEVIEQLLIALFCRGHALLVGVPGLAKTLLISSIARSLNLQFSRIQFTPDLMPSDITGTEVIEEDRTTGKRHLRFVHGPLFANVLLADEINRTPPKTQAALLEAMQEHRVSVGGTQHHLPGPFFVLATQNPIEQEGTYPLPEAQLDRFMFMIHVGYPSEEEELEIVRRTTARREAEVRHVLSAEDVLRIQAVVRDVPVAEHVARYALRLVRATRLGERAAGPPVAASESRATWSRPGTSSSVAGAAPEDRNDPVRRYLAWGAGPRASQALVLAGKARAIMHGRDHVTPEDILAVAHPVLRHRLITNFNAEADGVRPDALIDRLLESVSLDPADRTTAAQLDAAFR